VKTYWQPVPHDTAETAVMLCVDPLAQTKVSGVLTDVLLPVKYPEPVGFDVIVMITPKLAVSLTGAFIVTVAEPLVPE